ncbi:MAG TPA: hypothetical protein VFU33_03090 [Gaiellaceae bacterium]|nr:hypothetical protein [Gaiellaceae bacterium]
MAGEGGPGAGGNFACPVDFFACPGGVLVWPGGVISRPESFFACPGGRTEADWRTAAAGCVDGSDGFSGTVAVGGGGVEETGVGFGRPAPAVCAGCAAAGVTGTTGVATAADGGEAVLCDVWCPALGMVGA